VLEATPEGRTTGYRRERPFFGRVVVDSGTAVLTGAMKDSYSSQRELEMVNADTAIKKSNTSQFKKENQTVSESDAIVCNDSNQTAGHVRFFDQSGGAEDTPDGNDGR
jgi:hypothetical protein